MEKTTYYVKKVIQVPDGNGRLVEHEIFISVPYEDVIREIGDYVTPRIRGQKVAQICAEDDSEENSEELESDNGIAKIAAITTGAGVAAGVVVRTVATAALTSAGFTSAGIAAGSMAAGIQSGIGSVAAGSLFASLQSTGALGGFAILGPVGFASAVLVAAGVGTGLVIRKVMKDNELARRRR